MINFQQPRYIVPLIVLPFIYVFFYLFHYTMAGDEVSLPVVRETASINATLPDPFLDEGDLKDKFDAFQEAHKNKRDFSAMQEIDRREEQTDDPSLVQAEIAREILATDQELTVASAKPILRGRSFASSVRQEQSDPKQQMHLFRAQMNYLDSLFRGENGNSGDGEMETGIPVNGQQSVEERPPSANQRRPMGKEPLKVEKSNGIQSAHFNTIMKDKTSFFIKAILDEELRVKKDSRIRFRLLEEVVIGDQLIPKGQYLYGLVASFQAQRIEVHIPSILLQDQILEISLDIYDLDGLKGLYVPESQFRELAKNMGSSMASGQQLSLDAPPDNSMQLMYGLAKDAFNTTTQAASKSLRKNKAILKYNTMVYLVNTNSSKEPQTL